MLRFGNNIRAGISYSLIGFKYMPACNISPAMTNRPTATFRINSEFVVHKLRIQSSGIWRCVVWQKLTNVLKEPNFLVPIFFVITAIITNNLVLQSHFSALSTEFHLILVNLYMPDISISEYTNLSHSLTTFEESAHMQCFHQTTWHYSMPHLTEAHTRNRLPPNAAHHGLWRQVKL
jgi:hypothetical protein